MKKRFIGRKIVIGKKTFFKGAQIEESLIAPAFANLFEDIEQEGSAFESMPVDEGIQFVRAVAKEIGPRFKVVPSDKKGYFEVMNEATGVFINDKPLKKKLANELLAQSQGEIPDEDSPEPEEE